MAAVPFRGQEERWPEEAQRRYRELLEKADEVVVVADIHGEHGGDPGQHDPRALLLRRNRWMVERSPLVVAVWDGSPGGTASTVREAVRMGRPLVRYDPRRPELGWLRYSGLK